MKLTNKTDPSRCIGNVRSNGMVIDESDDFRFIVFVPGPTANFNHKIFFHSFFFHIELFNIVHLAKNRSSSMASLRHPLKRNCCPLSSYIGSRNTRIVPITEARPWFSIFNLMHLYRKQLIETKMDRKLLIFGIERDLRIGKMLIIQMCEANKAWWVNMKI